MPAGWRALQREDEEPHRCGGAAVPLAALQPHPARHQAGGKQRHHLRRAGLGACAVCRCALCAMSRLSSDRQCFGTDLLEDIPIFSAHSTVNEWVMLDVS